MNTAICREQHNIDQHVRTDQNEHSNMWLQYSLMTYHNSAIFDSEIFAFILFINYLSVNIYICENKLQIIISMITFTVILFLLTSQLMNNRFVHIFAELQYNKPFYEY